MPVMKKQENPVVAHFYDEEVRLNQLGFDDLKVVYYEDMHTDGYLQPISAAFWEFIIDSDGEKIIESSLSEIFKTAGWQGHGEIWSIAIPACFFANGTQDGGDNNSIYIYYAMRHPDKYGSYLAYPKSLKLSLPV